MPTDTPLRYTRTANFVHLCNRLCERIFHNQTAQTADSSCTCTFVLDSVDAVRAPRDPDARVRSDCRRPADAQALDIAFHSIPRMDLRTIVNMLIF